MADASLTHVALITEAQASLTHVALEPALADAAIGWVLLDASQASADASVGWVAVERVDVPADAVISWVEVEPVAADASIGWVALERVDVPADPPSFGAGPLRRTRQAARFESPNVPEPLQLRALDAPPVSESLDTPATDTARSAPVAEWASPTPPAEPDNTLPAPDEAIAPSRAAAPVALAPVEQVEQAPEVLAAFFGAGQALINQALINQTALTSAALKRRQDDETALVLILLEAA